jgi:PIN domain nuclease of toxin-antitoxin system/antitoxin (DNA-binding transcriptional repressor) of toxin-antitoxin stability system
MKQTTVHQPKTHFARILARVKTGDEIVVCRGDKPIGKTVPYRDVGRARPKTGTVTSKPLKYSKDCFASLTDEELKDLGALMRLLMGACPFLWLTQEPDRLSGAARDAIDHSQNKLPLSHVSIWEMFLKQQSGKLKLPAKPDKWVKGQLSEWVISELQITLASLNETNRLPPHHRDPIDRLLVAQAKLDGLTVLTPDPMVQKYRVKWIW